MLQFLCVPLFAPVQMRLMFVDSVLVLKQEIEEETESMTEP